MSEQELRRLLAHVVPEAAMSGNRADAARTWARRRRNRSVASVSAAAVGLAIAIPVAIAGSADQRAEPTPRPRQFACPEVKPAVQALPTATTGAARALTRGAVAVRLCTGFVGGYQAPVDALVGPAADALAASIQSLRPRKNPLSGCTSFALSSRPPYFFVFTYRDGHTENVTAKTTSCIGGVSVGGSQLRGGRWDAVRFVQRFNAALLEQRSVGKPPSGARTAVSCGEGNRSVSPAGVSPLDQGDVPDLTTAVLCWDRNLISKQPTQEARFDPQDLRLVLQSMRSWTGQGASSARDCGQGSINYRIVGETAWGDRYMLFGDCGGFELGGSGAFRVWKPTGDTAAIFDKMLATGTNRLTMPGATASPEEVLSTWADLINEGDSRAGELWVHGQPSGLADHRPVFISPGKGGLLPNGPTSTIAPGYAHATELDAIWADSTVCPENRAKVFVLVRQSDDEPWQILSWTDHGAFGRGC